MCGGGVAGLATPAGGGEGEAMIGLVGAGSADGAGGFAAGTCGGDVAGLFADDCAPGVIAADGVVGVEGFAAGVCGGSVAGLALPGVAGGVPGVTAADGVVGVTDVPVADGRGCPFIPGSGWPRCGGG
jgi:hypothetical protein